MPPKKKKSFKIRLVKFDTSLKDQEAVKRTDELEIKTGSSDRKQLPNNYKNQPKANSEDHLNKSTNDNESFATVLIKELKLEERNRPPKLVLSIIGDSSSFVPKPWLIPVLKAGLIATAEGAKDYLLLYEGSQERISSIVFESMEDLKNLREDYNEDNLQKIIDLKSALCEKMDHKPSSFAEFHAQILKTIAMYKIKLMQLENEDLIWKLPVLTVVAEGDLYTIDAIVQVLENDLPILLLKGSGKAADFVASFVEGYRNNGSDSSKYVQEYIKEKSAILFGIVSPRDQTLGKLGEILNRIHECKCLITIIDINKETKPNDFTESVTTSIIRGWSHMSGDRRPNDKSCESPEKLMCEDKSSWDVSVHIDKSEKAMLNKNKCLPIPVTRNALLTSKMKNEAFMDKYQDTLNPASLPLYYYIAYQIIQEMDLDIKKRNFKILLKEAIIADRHEYVSVLLEEDKVRVGSNQVSDIYQKTLLQNVMDETDFQNVFKWASKRSIHTLEKAYKLKKNADDLNWQIVHKATESKIDETLQKIEDVFLNAVNLRKDEIEIQSQCKNLKALEGERLETSIRALVSTIQRITCKMCVTAGRNICQSLLDYPKKYWENIQNESSKIGDGTVCSCVKPTSNTPANCECNMAYEDLLIWAILENRPNLASIFWAKCRNQLLCALLASCLYSKMAYKVKSTKDQSRYDDMLKQARIFEERSLYLQSKLYEDNAELTMELVVTEQTVWDIKISPLECAHENMMLNFLSQACCQRRLNKIWYNDIGGSVTDCLTRRLFTGCSCCCSCKLFANRNIASCRYCERYETTNEFKLSKFICSPVARFCIHYAFFFVAMVCYSAFLLTELDFIDGIQSVEIYEWIVYTYFLGDILEEYRHVILKELKPLTILTETNQPESLLNHSWWYRLKKYLYSFWNVLDVISFILTVAAIFIRFFKPTTTNNLARRVYSLSLFTMYMRFLHVILVQRKLGPKIIMIKEMVKDLFRFIGILLVFMMGVGVLYHANMYPNHKDMWNPAGWTYWRIWKIISLPYWQIYGDSLLDTFDENSTTPCTTIQSEWESNPDIERCNRYDWVLVVIAAFYMLISNLLLVNLVIALFSNRFERVQVNSGKLWRYLRYEVIMDYRTRIPAPLNLLIRPIMIFMTIAEHNRGMRVYQGKEKKQKEKFIKKMNTLQSVHAVNCILEI